MHLENGTYHELTQAWKALRATHDVRVREVACVNAPRTLLCIDAGDYTKPTIALSAGVHGDEPAGPWALVDLVQRRELDDAYSYRIWACMNPSGFDLRTRESAEGVDLNRTFGRGGGSPEARAILTANRDSKFLLSIDLHEDCDAVGFYCYEYGGERGPAAIAAVEAAGFPIESLEGLELGPPALDAVLRKERGRITADPFEEAKHLQGLSYTLILARGAAAGCLTFETPSRLAFGDRVAMHQCALKAVISQTSRK